MSRITASSTPLPPTHEAPDPHTSLLNHSSSRSSSYMGVNNTPLGSPGRASYVSAREGDGTHYSGADCGDSSTPRVSLVLENAGSVARDHLASERTFLAYVRTSLTIASAGVALAQLLTISDRLNNQVSVPLKPFEVYARPLAASSIILALYVLGVGVSRYFTVQVALTEGLFPVARLRLGLIALALATIITVVFGLLLAGRRH
ncbi:hypothetical protein C8R44DRAFT_395937 [Mycena epipterygia]|nr:hypothetical protein C8R44DRAFT_395937 [Mycena epipterygia]